MEVELIETCLSDSIFDSGYEHIVPFTFGTTTTSPVTPYIHIKNTPKCQNTNQEKVEKVEKREVLHEDSEYLSYLKESTEERVERRTQIFLKSLNTHRTRYECIACGFCCTLKRDFRVHLNSHIIDTDRTCPCCHDRLPRISSFRQHFEKHIQSKSVYICCGVEFKSITAFSNHQSDCHSPSVFLCSSCDQHPNGFKRRKNWLKHIFQCMSELEFEKFLKTSPYVNSFYTNRCHPFIGAEKNISDNDFSM